jgi:hypothetical protein
MRNKNNHEAKFWEILKKIATRRMNKESRNKEK